MEQQAAKSGNTQTELRRDWRVLTAVTVAASFGFPTMAFFSIGIFAPIMAEELGWNFASIMGSLLVASVTILVCGPLVGRWIDRHGPRQITAMSLVAFGFSYMLLALSSESLVQYYVTWILISVAGVGATAISFTQIISSVFRRQRGFALGIALSSSGISAMLVKPLAAVTIALLGWREAIFLIGLLPVLIGAPALLWGVPKRKDTVSEHQTAVGAPLHQEGVTLRQAARQKAFWILLVAFTAIAFANGAPIPNLENILATHDFNADEVVGITSLIGISLIVGRVSGGWLIDRVWAPLIGLLMLISAALGCWILSLETITDMHAVVATIMISLAAGVEYDLLSFLVARYLGRRSYGAIYSIIFGLFAVSAGVGPVVLGSFYDSHGTYTWGLLICATLLLFAGATLIALGRYPNLEKASDAASTPDTER